MASEDHYCKFGKMGITQMQLKGFKRFIIKTFKINFD